MLYLLCQYEAFRSIGGFSMSLYAYEEIDFVFRLKSRSWKTGKKFTVLHIIELLLLGEEQTTVFSNKANRRFQFPGPDSIYASLSVTKNLVKKLGKRTLGYGIQISCSRWAFSQGTKCASQESLRLLVSFPAN